MKLACTEYFMRCYMQMLHADATCRTFISMRCWTQPAATRPKLQCVVPHAASGHLGSLNCMGSSALPCAQMSVLFDPLTDKSTWQSAAGKRASWNRDTCYALAAAILEDMPGPARERLRDKSFSGGDIIVMRHGTRVVSNDLRKNAWILRPCSRILGIKAPAPFFIADAFVLLDALVDQALFPRALDDEEARLSLALKEADRLKRCLAYLRKLVRNSADSKGDRVVAKLKALMPQP